MKRKIVKLILIIYFFFLTLINSNSLFAQKKTYVGGGGFSSFYLEFADDEKFREWIYSCVSTHYGRGRYRIADNKITFEYDEPPTYLDRVWIEKIGDLKDSIELDIVVRDFETKELIDNFSIYPYDSHNGPERIIICERVPFYEENYYEVYAKKQDKFRYESQLFEISRPGKYYIQVNLLYGQPLGGIKTLELKFMNEDSLQFVDRRPYYRLNKK